MCFMSLFRRGGFCIVYFIRVFFIYMGLGAGNKRKMKRKGKARMNRENRSG